MELNTKLDKLAHRIDYVNAERRCSVKTIRQQLRTPRTEAPLHPRRLAWHLHVSCQSIGHTFELRGDRGSATLEDDSDVAYYASRDSSW